MQNKSNSVLNFNSNNLLYTVAAVCFFVMLCLILMSQGTYDPGDGVQHYLIAKYALHHPHLLLDHWGKPIYTLLCMPFAQFGFVGSNIFNLLCNTFTAFLACKIVRQLGFDHTVLCFILVFFSPLFFMTSFSGLTEPTFALLLTASVWLMIKGNMAVGAIVLSFLPFARTEGFFIIPVFAVYLMMYKQWKSIFLLGTGTAIYSLAGYLADGDLLWIVHQNPYKGALDIYGKGSLFHFVAANDRLFGLPLVVLFVIACLALLLKGKKHPQFSWGLILLVLGSFTVYFVMHAVFWWKGLFGSLGLHRVMAGVAPMFSIVAFLGLNTVLDFSSKINKLKPLMLIAMVTAVIIWPIKQYQPPLTPDLETQVLINTASWVKQHKVPTNKKVFCMYPMLSMLLNVDPFNTAAYISTCMLQYPDFSNSLQTGDLIFWDSHFGVECKVTPNDIAAIPHVKQLTQFQQSDGSGQTFKVVVFSVVK